MNFTKGEADADAFIDRLLEIDGLPDVSRGEVKAYLESKTGDEIVQGFWNVPGSPVDSSDFRDGYVISDDTTEETIISGQYNRLPIILGSNADEMKFYLPYTVPRPIDNGGSIANVIVSNNIWVVRALCLQRRMKNQDL